MGVGTEPDNVQRHCQLQDSMILKEKWAYLGHYSVRAVNDINVFSTINFYYHGFSSTELGI